MTNAENGTVESPTARAIRLVRQDGAASALNVLLLRIVAAQVTLDEAAATTKTPSEYERIVAKRSGVALARSYVEEMLREQSGREGEQ